MASNKISRFGCLFLLGLTAACSGDDQEPETTQDSLPGAASPPVAVAPPTSVEPRWLPAELLVRRRACPFECCRYGQWTARTDIPVLASERGREAPIFVMRSGESFRADSGNVHVTEVALVAVEDSVADGAYWSFGRGDTLAVLDYIGEGHYNVYHKGKVQEVDGFWAPARQPKVAELLGEPKTEWWVHVTTTDGRSGWVEMARGVEVGGADRCA